MLERYYKHRLESCYLEYLIYTRMYIHTVHNGWRMFQTLSYIIVWYARLCCREAMYLFACLLCLLGVVTQSSSSNPSGITIVLDAILSESVLGIGLFGRVSKSCFTSAINEHVLRHSSWKRSDPIAIQQ